MGIATDDTEIGNQLALARRSHAGTNLLDAANDFIAGSERQRALEVRIATAPDHRVGEAGAGGAHLDADLARTGIGDVPLIHQFQDLGAAELRDKAFGRADGNSDHHPELKVTTFPNQQPAARNCKKSNLLELLERVKGIEPSYSAWKAAALPLSYTRGGRDYAA